MMTLKKAGHRQTMNKANSSPRLVPCLVIAGLLFTSQNGYSQDELKLFPQLLATHSQGDDYTTDSLFPALDIYLAGDWREIQYLVEYNWSEDRHVFERLQLGISFSDDAIIWLGRFHTPYGYWNHTYHHTQYLQASISRPSIEAYAEQGGIYSNHLAGILYEQKIDNADGSSMHLELAYGLASSIQVANAPGNVVLEDVDLFSFRHSEHDSAVTLRGSYEPAGSENDTIGFFILNANQVVINGIYDRIDFESMGLFTRFSWLENVFIVSAFTVSTEFTGPGVVTNVPRNFQAAYLHYELSLNEMLKLYARAENTWNAENQPYLDLLDSYILQREVAGIRFDFYQRHAVKLEWLRDHVASGENNSVYVEWSAIF